LLFSFFIVIIKSILSELSNTPQILDLLFISVQKLHTEIRLYLANLFYIKERSVIVSDIAVFFKRDAQRTADL
jgi:hypothetical protein